MPFVVYDSAEKAINSPVPEYERIKAVEINTLLKNEKITNILYGDDNCVFCFKNGHFLNININEKGKIEFGVGINYTEERKINYLQPVVNVVMSSSEEGEEHSVVWEREEMLKSRESKAFRMLYYKDGLTFVYVENSLTLMFYVSIDLNTNKLILTWDETE